LFGYLREHEGYVLLERMEGNVPGYLSYSAKEGEVVCVFKSVIEAEQFYMHWRARIPGEGWDAVRLETEELVKVLQNYDLVSVTPQPNRTPLPRRELRLYAAETGVTHVVGFQLLRSTAIRTQDIDRRKKFCFLLMKCRETLIQYVP
jgi:hypothetical protein